MQRNKPRRELTAYNKFMSQTVPKLREQFPGKAHREVFKMAAEQWKKAPENPDNFYARLPDPPKTASSSSRPSGSSSRPKRRTATGSNSRTSGAAGSSSTGASSSRK